MSEYKLKPCERCGEDAMVLGVTSPSGRHVHLDCKNCGHWVAFMGWEKDKLERFTVEESKP